MSYTELIHADATKLEDLIDRESLRQICGSFFDLFGLSLRVFSATGALLADVHEQRSICRYVNRHGAGRIACAQTVATVQNLLPQTATLTHPCFTGAIYTATPILYDDRCLGRFVVGPFLPAEIGAVPQSLLDVDPGIDVGEAKSRLASMPRVREETLARIVAHFRNVLQLMLFAGHRARMTSSVHLASIREGYRELAEKTARLEEAYESLKELDRLKGDFLATISHELRTPLTAVIGYTDMLISGIGGELNEQQRGFAQTIQSKGELLLELITNMLELNKLERGQLTLRPEPLDPMALAAEIEEIVLPQADARRIQLRVQSIEPAPATLVADAVRIKQVLLNLVTNAIKFTPPEGEVALIVRSAELAGDAMESDDDGETIMGMAVMMGGEPAVQFEVRDTGPGIAEENLARIFDPFYQIDQSSTRQHGGAGLGLAIVKSLVDAHGGKIDVDSRIDQGTTFVVILPERPAT
ncbi:MAG: ATP-binding protein [Proteobacteria bacterium]|nr:ATP-binding protein [Pseudomonadota bacterium]